jgi:hydroxymethylpyrimidine pyrophosphatase-like HAD family hydrolase
MRIFIDIDGTLTHNPKKMNGEPWIENIDKVKRLILEGNNVVIWSMGGTRYARKFCKKYGITPWLAIGKPHLVIDDNPDIRPRDRMKILDPKEMINYNYVKQ